jgi:hypothetical protein
MVAADHDLVGNGQTQIDLGSGQPGEVERLLEQRPEVVGFRLILEVELDLRGVADAKARPLDRLDKNAGHTSIAHVVGADVDAGVATIEHVVDPGLRVQPAVDDLRAAAQRLIR